MIGNESFHGALQDATQGEALGTGSLFELRLIVESHRAYHADGEVGALIRQDIVAEEGTEVVDHQLAEQRVVQMLAYI